MKRSVERGEPDVGVVRSGEGLKCWRGDCLRKKPPSLFSKWTFTHDEEAGIKREKNYFKKYETESICAIASRIPFLISVKRDFLS